MSIARKSVLITGCSAGGIGAALAEAFHQHQYHVFATVRNESKIPKSLSNSDHVSVLKLDVLSADSIAAAVKSVEKATGGKLDVLVNNSGTIDIQPALDLKIEEAKQLFDLNFWAPIAMTQAFAPMLIEAKGYLVNNTSACAFVPMALSSMYNASKAALAQATETMRLELAPLGVRTIALITTGVKTGSFAKYEAPRLPQNSRYNGLQDFIDELAEGKVQEAGIAPKQYAETVVGKIEKGAIGMVWAGAGASSARVANSFLPRSAFDMVVESMVPISKKMAELSKHKAA